MVRKLKVSSTPIRIGNEFKKRFVILKKDGTISQPFRAFKRKSEAQKVLKRRLR